MSEVDRKIVEKYLLFVAGHLSQRIRLEHFCLICSVSPKSIRQIFNRLFGIPPMRFLWILRTFATAEILRLYPHMTITQAALLCGFNNLEHFSRRHREVFGMTPRQQRRQATLSPLSGLEIGLGQKANLHFAKMAAQKLAIEILGEPTQLDFQDIVHKNIRE